MDAGATPDAVSALRDLTKAVHRCRPVPGGWEIERLGLRMEGPKVRLPEAEQEIARIGGALQLYGLNGGGSMGQHAMAAASFTVTAQRIVVVLIKGDSIRGPIDELVGEIEIIVVPWVAVDAIERPAKKSFADRIAGDVAITIGNYSTTLATLKFVPKAALGPPPAEQPLRRIKSDEAHALLARAAAEFRLRSAGPEEAARLARVRDGHFTVNGSDLTAWLVNPDD